MFVNAKCRRPREVIEICTCNKQLGQYFALKSRTCINQSRSLLAAFGADMSCAEPQFETHLDCVALCMMDTSNDESFLWGSQLPSLASCLIVVEAKYLCLVRRPEDVLRSWWRFLREKDVPPLRWLGRWESVRVWDVFAAFVSPWICQGSTHQSLILCLTRTFCPVS